MAVQWLTIGSISGPAARHLWEVTGRARKSRDTEDEVPIETWNTLVAPILAEIDRHADQPPIWSYHRSIDPWLMGNSYSLPFSRLPARQRKVLGCHHGPESLYLAYRANWPAWLVELEQQRRKLSKVNVGSAEISHLYHALMEACSWCHTLAKRIPAAVFLRRTCLRASSGDDELLPLANKTPAWLKNIPAC